MRDFYVRTYILHLNLVVEGGTGGSRYINGGKVCFISPFRVVVVSARWNVRGARDLAL